MNLDNHLKAIEQKTGIRPQRTGPNQYKSLCPAHYDNKPSLSMTVKGGKVLLHCHAGCSYEEMESLVFKYTI